MLKHYDLKKDIEEKIVNNDHEALKKLFDKIVRLSFEVKPDEEKKNKNSM